MAGRNDDRPVGEAFEILPGADGSFKFSHNGGEVTEPQIGKLSPEARADRQMIEETYRRLTGCEPPTTPK